jgi:aryl-alcohol dehydrogenase-like predicted oxidoreductase
MLPIPGTGSVAHLEENVRAAAIKLGPDEVERLGGRLTGGRGRQQPV